MRVLVAIESCIPNKQRRDWQRATWLPQLQYDYRFFVGGGNGCCPEGNTVVLDCKDDYKSLPEKTLEVLKWTRRFKYDILLKLDDDVYVRPERLQIPNEDYVGHSYGHHLYCSGAAYWLSAKAMDAVIQNWKRRSNAEDSCIGESLRLSGINLTEDSRYRVGWKSLPKDIGENEFPNPNNNTITFHMYFPHKMMEMHKNWETHKQLILPPDGKIESRTLNESSNS